MTTATKVAAFVGALAVVFAAALGTGAVVGSPIDTPPAVTGTDHHTGEEPR
ncbi:hypothetical protein ACFYVR_12820 [Rhodococcus sp. NPDC003318]|uniref:hypothetical protein n=1 Tax=Rhodococcus sp. NPDC003318 TaxID=3364503 RepID=UPI0036A8D5AE